ncbi:MAG: Glycosyltransferases involved in cell wall biogenesis [Burkholderiaceae bacterium]|jgi:glycosyltransferase involved in cell wall biosynthesis|nr:MAG: Glycosyltransferases involved in cell wall biogenesis [Burkholderiaceae bacterium]
MSDPSPPPVADHDAAASPRLTIAVLTKNEAARIARCLRSAAFANELIVVDSGSSDDTVALARSLGAQVFVHADWQGFAVQRNRLLSHASGDYIFFLDADEEITPALREELQDAVRSGFDGVGCVRWRVVAFGRELRHFRSQAPVERLFRRAQLQRFDGAVHERALLAGEPLPRTVFGAPLKHYSRDSVHSSLEKLTQYAMLGAAKRARAGKRGGVLVGIAYGASVFVRLYVFKLGFLGGGPGFLFCYFIALECFFRCAAQHYDSAALSNTIGR